MNTKHNPTCSMTFGRKDPACPRCRELLAGARPRAWRGTSPAFAIRQAKVEAKHTCGPACGPVCTYGDW